MGDPIPKLPPAPDPFTPAERAEADRLAARFREMGLDLATLHEESTVTLAECIAWLEGDGPCPEP